MCYSFKNVHQINTFSLNHRGQGISEITGHNQREIEKVQNEIEIQLTNQRSTERLKKILKVMQGLHESNTAINRYHIETYIDEMQSVEDYESIQGWINLYRRNHERIQEIEGGNNTSKKNIHGNIGALKNAQQMFRDRIKELLDRSEYINIASIDAMLDAIDQGETPQVPKYDSVVSIRTAQEGNEQYFEESIPGFNLFKYKRVNFQYQLGKYIRVELIWQSGNNPEEKALVWLKTPAENNGIPKILHRGFQLFNTQTRKYEDWSSNFKAQENLQEETISVRERVLTDREGAEIGLSFKEAKEKKRVSVSGKDGEENMKLDLHIAGFGYFKVTRIFPKPENAVDKPLESRGYRRVQISYQYTDDIEMHTDVVIYIRFPISEGEKLDIAEVFLGEKTEKQVNGNNKIDKELVTRGVIQKIEIKAIGNTEKGIKNSGNTVNSTQETIIPDSKKTSTEKEISPKGEKKGFFEGISSLISRAGNGIKKLFGRKW